MMRGLNSWQAQANYLVAIQYGDVERCAALLAAGADADQTFKINSVTRPALCLGVERGTYALVELLLRSGVAINRRDSRGSTSLHVAVEMGYDSIVELLLQNRADVNAADNQLITPLHIAAKRGALNIVSSLISHGSDVNKKDDNGKSPLSYACASPNVSFNVVSFLLDNEAEADDLDFTGYTPLLSTLLSPNFDFETVKVLINQRARLDLKTKDGNAPIHIVLLSNNPSKWQCLDLLLKNGCDINLCNQMGQSPVHLACLMSDIKSLRILLRSNAETNSVDRLGVSPLAYCITNGNGISAFAHLLMDGGAKEDLSRMSLHRLKESFKNDLHKRMINPTSLKSIARKALCGHFGPYSEEWFTCQINRTELPRTLVPFVLFNESDYK